MGQPIEDPLAPQCGNCVFWDKIPDQPGKPASGECVGVPPTPIPVQAGQNMLTKRMEFQIEMIRPIMAHNARPCAFHKRRAEVMIGPSSKLD